MKSLLAFSLPFLVSFTICSMNNDINPFVKETTTSVLASALAHLRLEIDSIQATIEEIDTQICDSTNIASYYSKAEAYFEQMKKLNQLLYDLKHNNILNDAKRSKKEKNKEYLTMPITKVLELFERAHLHRMHTYEQGSKFFPKIASQIIPHCFINESIERYMQEYVNQQLGLRPTTEDEYIAHLQKDPYFASISLAVLKKSIKMHEVPVTYQESNSFITKHIPSWKYSSIPVLDVSSYFQRMRALENTIVKY